MFDSRLLACAAVLSSACDVSVMLDEPQDDGPDAAEPEDSTMQKDDTDRVQAMLDNGGTVNLDGDLYIYRTLKVTKAFTTISGNGAKLHYWGTSGSAIRIHNEDSTISVVTIDNLNIVDGAENTTGIDIDDAVVTTVKNVRVLNWRGVGMRISGRDTISVRDVYLKAKQPLLLESSLDQSNFHNLYLVQDGGGYPCIDVSTQTVFSQVSFTGYQAWAGGTHGFYMDDSESIGRSLRISFENVRWEQASSNSGWAFYIDANMQAVDISGAEASINANGFFFNRVGRVTLSQPAYYGAGDYLVAENYHELEVIQPSGNY